MNIFRITINKWSKIKLDLEKEFNTIIYSLDEWLILNSKNIWEKELVELNNDGDFINMSSTKEVRLIVLSWKPLWEKVDQYWPFVMNSRTEILKAMWDFKMWKMWYLIEEFD